MHTGVTAAVLVIAMPAAAETVDGPGVRDEAPDDSRVEAGGFLGVDHYGDEVGLGGSPAPEQRPQTAPTFGGRLTYVPLRIGSRIHLDLGVEAEAAFTASWTGYGFDGPRPSYFAPVLSYKANLLVRLGVGWLQPHLTAGGGGETVISSSPYMAKETDPIFQWGAGFAVATGPRWRLRFDGRQGVMEAIDGSMTLTYEAHMSIVALLGVRTPRTRVERPVVAEPARPPSPPPPPPDSDFDEIPDPSDRCPTQPEFVNGIEDEDGCPESDRDGDGLVDVADKCPDAAEDLDAFQDEDGCPDDDNDQDGVPDVRDRCPLEAESANGIDDDDGCADQIPIEITTALAQARKVKFERGRAPLSRAARAALDKAIVVALNNPRMKLTLTVRPEAADQAATDLATKRLAVVKFYLTERGVAMGNLTTQVGAPVAAKTDPLVELAVTQ